MEKPSPENLGQVSENKRGFLSRLFGGRELSDAEFYALMDPETRRVMYDPQKRLCLYATAEAAGRAQASLFAQGVASVVESVNVTGRL